MNQIAKEDINQWVKTFEGSYSSDRKVFLQANDSIKTKIKTDGKTFINICAQILIIDSKDDESIKKSKCLASTLLRQILYVNNNKEEIDFNKKNINPELIELLIKAIKSNIFSDINIIGKNCSKCYSSLYLISQENQSDGINYIVNSLKDITLLPNGFINIIKTARYIISPLTSKSDIYNQSEVQFLRIFFLCMKILSQPPNLSKFTIELRKEACKYIYELVDLNPSVLNEEGKVGGRIPDLLKSLSNSFKIINEKLYTKLYKLMSLLIKKFYTQTPEFLDTVLQYLDIGLNLDSSQLSCIISALNFLSDISENEYKVVINYIGLKLTKPLEPLFCENLINKYLPVCIQILESVDEKEIEVNDIKNKPRPFMFANKPITNFLKILPKKTSALIKEKIDDYIQKDKWTFKYAAALLIDSIFRSNILCLRSSDPFSLNWLEYYNFGMKKDYLVNDLFESKYMDYLIDLSLQDKVPKLRETALSIAKNVFEFMEDELETSPNLEPLIMLIDSILSSNEKKILSSNDDLLLYRKYADFSICLAYVTPFNFHELYKICKNLFDIGVLNNDESIMINSNNTINKIIIKASSDDENITELREMFTKSYDSLTENKIETDNENTFLIVQACLCSNLLHLLKYSNNESKVFTLLCELMKNENIYLYREIIKDVYDYITITPSSANILIKQFAYKSLASMDSKLVLYSYILIDDIYNTKKFDVECLNVHLPSILENLYTIFKDNEMKYHQFNILITIENIFGVFKNNTLENISIILKLFFKFADFIFDQKINNDIYRYTLIYQFLDCFKSLYTAIYDAPSAHIKVIITSLEKIISNILDSIPSIDSFNEKMAIIVKGISETCDKECKDILLNSPSISKIRKLPIYDQIRSNSDDNDESNSDDNDDESNSDDDDDESNSDDDNDGSNSDDNDGSNSDDNDRSNSDDNDGSNSDVYD